MSDLTHKQVLKLVDDVSKDRYPDEEQDTNKKKEMAEYTLDTIQEVIKNKTITKEALRQYLLIEGANAIRAISDRANGVQNNTLNSSGDKRAQDKLFNAVLPILQQAGDLQKIESETVAEVIKAVAEGNMTIQDAQEMIKVIKGNSISITMD